MNYQKLLLLLSCIFICSSAFTQSIDLRDHEAFFNTKKAAYGTALEEYGLVPYMIVGELEVRKQKVILELQTGSWDQLSDKALADGHIELAQMLMNQMLFVFNLEPTQAIIKVDLGKETIFIKYEEVKNNNTSENELSLAVSQRTKQSTIDSHLMIEVKDLDIPSSNMVSSEMTIKELKDKLAQGLDSYFKTKEANFSLDDYEMKVYKRIKNELKIRVRNVKQVVYTKKSYYEAIDISFVFVPKQGEVLINYTLYSKYGSGIFSSPFEEDYIDTPEEETKQFDMDLQELIIKSIGK